MALREVNLIPADLAARRQVLRHLSFWAGCLLVSLALIWGFYLYQRYVVLANEAAVSKLNETHTHLAAKIEEIKRIQRELETLSAKRLVLESAAGSQSYARVLVKLAETMNECTWLTKLAINKGNREVNVQLSGFSFSNEKLGNFITQLSNDPMVRAVSLKYAKETQIVQSSQNAGKSLRLIDFQIECSVSGV